MTRKKPRVHPGEISQYALAHSIGVPSRRINEIVLCKRFVSADTALRLGRYFGMEPQFWLNLQSRHDLDAAKDELGARLEREVRPRAA